MKATLMTSLLLILALAGQVLYASPAAAQGEPVVELLTNGGFESGEKSPWGEYCGNLTITDFPGYVHEGNYAAEFTLGQNRQQGWIYQVVRVLPDKEYELSGWAFAEDISNIERVFLRISWYASMDGTGPELSYHDHDDSSPLNLSNYKPDYLSLTTSAIAAPKDAKSAKVKAIVELPDPTQPATVYFDDFSFVGPQPPPHFYGTVTITNDDGSIGAPDGLTISAKIGGVERASCQTVNGEYSLDVPGEEGDTTILFYVQGVDTEQSVEWEGGSLTELDLTVVDNMPPSMPTNVLRTTPDNDNTPSFTWNAASDNLSGIAGYYVRIDDGDWTSVGDTTPWNSPEVADGEHTFYVKAEDGVGNKGEQPGSVDFSIDTSSDEPEGGDAPGKACGKGFCLLSSAL